jgi:oxygen-independent coproporphyrinogen-3 oxidase
VNLGLYIHIPFCQAKCSYCHFISIPYQREVANRYAKAILSEIEAFEPADDANVDSIFFGGGTPSLVPAVHIRDIIATCKRGFRFRDDCEASIEVNPGTTSMEKIASYRKIGINRASLGAQSFDVRELSSVGRRHNAEMIFDAVRHLKGGGFENINIDLMLGLPFQTSASWRRNLEIFAQLDIPHISVYMLDLEDQCFLSDLVAQKAVLLPEEDLISDMYLETVDFLATYGYLHYEISNFARPGFECRHNLKYWMRNPVLGFGVGSHSYDGISRYANKCQISDYIEAIETDMNPRAWREEIKKTQALQETLFLGLRLTDGIDWHQLNSKYGAEALSDYAVHIERLSDKGFIQWDAGRIKLTPAGMLISNEIFQHFV